MKLLHQQKGGSYTTFSRRHRRIAHVESDLLWSLGVLEVVVVHGHRLGGAAMNTDMIGPQAE